MNVGTSFLTASVNLQMYSKSSHSNLQLFSIINYLTHLSP